MASPTETTVSVLSPADEQTTRDFFEKFDVDVTTQDRLLAEFNAGESWDSMTSSATPVSVESRTIDGVSWTVSTFDDGSVRAEGIGSDAAAGGVSARGVDSCNYSVGKYGNFSNCHIYYWVGVVQLGFYANFSIVSGGNDKITSVWGGTLFAGGACSQSVPSPTIVKGTESSTGKAVAGLTAQATMCAINQTVNFPSYLHVGGNRADHVYS
ncbi:hypothetical protein [Microbacterium maritypicum]